MQYNIRPVTLIFGSLNNNNGLGDNKQWLIIHYNIWSIFTGNTYVLMCRSIYNHILLIMFMETFSWKLISMTIATFHFHFSSRPLLAWGHLLLFAMIAFLSAFHLTMSYGIKLCNTFSNSWKDGLSAGVHLQHWRIHSYLQNKHNSLHILVHKKSYLYSLDTDKEWSNV